MVGIEIDTAALPGLGPHWLDAESFRVGSRGTRFCASRYESRAATSAEPSFRLGMRTFLYFLKRAVAIGSPASSIWSGARMYRASHARSRRVVTPNRSGPTLPPCPIAWQGEHWLPKMYFPCSNLSGRASA